MALAELRRNAVERRNFLAPSMKLDDQKFEFIFVLDGSGSMDGEKILLARNALNLFLRSLPITCKFNVIGFGSHYEKLYPTIVEYTQKNLEHATTYALSLDAVLGSTYLTGYKTFTVRTRLQAISCKFSSLLMTDEPAADMSLVQNHKGFARIFSMGIGDAGIDFDFVSNLAKNGGGTAEFVPKSFEEIRTKVLNQLKVALKPSTLKAVPISL